MKYFKNCHLNASLTQNFRGNTGWSIQAIAFEVKSYAIG